MTLSQLLRANPNWPVATLPYSLVSDSKTAWLPPLQQPSCALWSKTRNNSTRNCQNDKVLSVEKSIFYAIRGIFSHKTLGSILRY